MKEKGTRYRLRRLIPDQVELPRKLPKGVNLEKSVRCHFLGGLACKEGCNLAGQVVNQAGPSYPGPGDFERYKKRVIELADEKGCGIPQELLKLLVASIKHKPA